MKLFVPIFTNCNDNPLPARWCVLALSEEAATLKARKLFQDEPDATRTFLSPDGRCWVIQGAKELKLHDGVIWL